MRERIKKLKLRRGKYDNNLKICKNCGREYNEKENFAWSCRTHRSQWSGELWWCCGKTHADAPGCKYSFHESKEDEDEYDDGLEQANSAQVRCLCCKEVGHTTEQCPRDPNIRSKADTDEEFSRIQKIKDYRKLNADTVVTTTHFLKQCILIPSRQSEDQERNYQENPFKRGSMKFDDFNYDIYNPYILIPEEKGRSQSKEEKRD